MGTVERLVLPDDAWAELRDPKKTPERLRRPVRQAAVELQRLVPTKKPIVAVSGEPDVVASDETKSAFGAPPIEGLVEEATEDEDAELVLPTEDEQLAIDAYNEAVILAVVTAWSYGDVTIDTVRDLPGDAYDALIEKIRELNNTRTDGAEGETDSLAADPSAPLAV